MRSRDHRHRAPFQLPTPQHAAQCCPGEEPVRVDGQVPCPLQPQARQEPTHSSVRAQGDCREAHIHAEAADALPRRGLHHALAAQQNLRGAQEGLEAPVGQPRGGQQGATGIGRQVSGLTGPLAQAHRDDDDLVVCGAQGLDLLLEELLPHLVGEGVSEQEQTAPARSRPSAPRGRGRRIRTAGRTAGATGAMRAVTPLPAGTRRDIGGRGDAGGHGDSCADGSHRPDDRTSPSSLVAAGSRAAPVAGGGGHCTTGPILGD